MSYIVCTMSKVKGTGGGLTAHIERRKRDEKKGYVLYLPKSVTQPERTVFNKDYILSPDKSRSAAIEERIKEISSRKIRDDQVKSLAFIVSSDHEKMKAIETSGRLDEWAADQIEWFRKEFGAENVVSAVLHMDEKTPHLHITVVPVVKNKGKHKGELKLCAKDVTNIHNLHRWQDEMAAVNAKWGMQRGQVGSAAAHVDPADYNAVEQELIRLQEAVDKKAAMLTAELKEKNKRLNVVKQEVSTAERHNEQLRLETRRLEEKRDEIDGILNKSKLYRENRRLTEQLEQQPSLIAQAKEDGKAEGERETLDTIAAKTKLKPGFNASGLANYINKLKADLAEAKKPKLPSVEEMKAKQNKDRLLEEERKEARDTKTALHNLIRAIAQGFGDAWQAAVKAATRLLKGNGSSYTSADENKQINALYRAFGGIVDSRHVTDTIIEEAQKDIKTDIRYDVEANVRSQFNGIARQAMKQLSR